MISSKSLALATAFASIALFDSAIALRSVVYIDEWHPTISKGADYSGVTHAIMAFVDPMNFTKEELFPAPPLMNVSDIRQYFNNDTKVGIAVGGWGQYSTNFGYVSTQANRTTFAKNLASWVSKNGYDFIDIDWEYPGGNGASPPPMSAAQEIEDFPLFLGEIKNALGKNNTNSTGVSLSVAGTKEGMLAFNSTDQAKKIWENIDFITVMAYDLVNRVSNATSHHSSVEGSRQAVQRYIDLGLDPQKINLGFAFYAKYFQTAGPCNGTQLPMGCPIAKAQSDNGTDTHTSGVLTYEPRNMNRTYPVPTESLVLTTNSECGWVNNTLTNKKCPDGFCCGESGWCGDTREHCVQNCQAGYGRCDGPDVAASFQRARANAMYDEQEGGLWYLDTSVTPNIFWTWENTIIMTRKFDEIVNNKTNTLGGVSGWSLGEDSYGWDRVKVMREMAQMHTPVVQTPPPVSQAACGSA